MVAPAYAEGTTRCTARRHFGFSPPTGASAEGIFALSVASAASQICSRAPRLAAKKADGSVVCVVDYAVQAYAANALRQTFPNDGLVAEESVDAFLCMSSEFQQTANKLCELDASLALSTNMHSSRRWTLDHIDGTRGFLHGESYSIGLALLSPRQTTPLCATIALPRINGFLLVDKGKLYSYGVQFGNDAGREQTVANWTRSAIDIELEGCVSASRLCCGSLVKYAAVAANNVHVFVQGIEQHAWVWDHAAGIAAVIASGGTVSDELGNAVDIGTGLNCRYVKIGKNANTIVATAKGQNHRMWCERVRNAVDA